MRKVIHLIPYDAIGGVEVAARTMARIRDGDTEFQVEYIYTGINSYADRSKAFSPIPLLSAARRVARQQPDLLIVSLWRASIVGILVKFLRPKSRLVLMLHSVSDVHVVDRVFTAWAGRWAVQIWGDSYATVRQRLPRVRNVDRRVISFVTRRLQPVPAKPVAPSFIFWGRINFLKGLDRALQLFAEVRSHWPQASFVIIGPDGGELDVLRGQVAAAGLTDSVTWLGGLPLEEIVTHAENASFYLQTSRWEGMGMSVVEAMQLGLVPVVTSVGEISSYCRHGENALIINSISETVEELGAVLRDDARYQQMRLRAISTWADKPLYAESMLEACRDLLSIGAGRA